MEITQLDTDTITAQATAPGKGGVGIVRISGKKSLSIAQAIIPKKNFLEARKATFTPFCYEGGDILDEGIAIYFPGPNSFTGEDVVELQGHGGPVILDQLLKTVINHGARMARPGEFTERAYLNDKLDLAQAEAIADLIDSSSEQAARSAVRSLQGEFSNKINSLVEQLIQLRIYVEAAIDFPEEEIDFLSDGHVTTQLQKIIDQQAEVFKGAAQGVLLKEGMTLVIVGRPNAGKSSLLNTLVGKETAIVTDIAGTTRDVLREHIHIDGMPLHIIDTAGLRESNDTVEKEGINRAWKEVEKADGILLVVDSQLEESAQSILSEFKMKIPQSTPLIVVNNKIDLSEKTPGVDNSVQPVEINLSAKEQLGIDEFREYLKDMMGFQNTQEGQFIARRRHLDALEKANEVLLTGQQQLMSNRAGELLAEDLRYAQNYLSEITGEFTSDDLLGRIFSSFCIGK